ncbi:MAG: YggT family protein [Rhodospirillales bacterium]|jgi:YggT family protein|nr:YggT family protein [Rhodospirillales bacterium]
MDVILGPMFWLIDTVITLVIWLLIAAAVYSWLVILNIINTRSRVVFLIGDFLARATEPMLRPIRRILPHLGGLDLSPLVLILLLLFLRQIIGNLRLATL